MQEWSKNLKTLHFLISASSKKREEIPEKCFFFTVMGFVSLFKEKVFPALEKDEKFKFFPTLVFFLQKQF